MIFFNQIQIGLGLSFTHQWSTLLATMIAKISSRKIYQLILIICRSKDSSPWYESYRTTSTVYPRSWIPSASAATDWSSKIKIVQYCKNFNNDSIVDESWLSNNLNFTPLSWCNFILGVFMFCQ